MAAVLCAVAFWTRAQLRRPRACNVTTRVVSRLYSNLSLAARPCVGHIGLNGDVAEWLKAAVC